MGGEGESATEVLSLKQIGRWRADLIEIRAP